MKNLTQIMKKLKTDFSAREFIEFKDYGIKIEIEPPTCKEEIKILAAIKDYEDAEYVENLKKHSLAVAIRKINDIDLDAEEIIIEGDDGKEIKKTKYLFLLDEIDTWPTTMRDVIFEKFSDIQEKLEDKLRRAAGFKNLPISGVPSQDAEEKFKKVDEPELGETEIDKLNQQIKNEQEEAQGMIHESNLRAVTENDSR